MVRHIAVVCSCASALVLAHVLPCLETWALPLSRFPLSVVDPVPGNVGFIPSLAVLVADPVQSQDIRISDLGFGLAEAENYPRRNIQQSKKWMSIFICTHARAMYVNTHSSTCTHVFVYIYIYIIYIYIHIQNRCTPCAKLHT